MLVEFSVSNFRSIRDEAVLTLVADNSRERRETNVALPAVSAGVRPTPLLCAAAIYGANGAGKTNLLRALDAMETTVLKSARGLDMLPVTSFLFDTARDEPTTLEATIIGQDGVRYRFGFKATAKAVLEEWLFAWPRGRVQKWFVRRGGEFEFGDRLAGDREVWGRATRPDALFLSTAITLNSEQLRPVFDWFASRLHIGPFDGFSPMVTIARCEDNQKAQVTRFLHASDMAISDLNVTKEKFDMSMLPDDMPMSLRETLKEDLSDAEVASVLLTHETADGVEGVLDLDEESDGTQKMFALAGPWIDALEHGNVVVMDELHDNLHPNLVRFLVQCFHDPRLNRHGAQLVFSTHETAILSQDVFRRDQIWFCEKDEGLATSLYPLSDFKPRQGVVNLERAYLSGRFGGLPFTTLDSLGEAEVGE